MPDRDLSGISRVCPSCGRRVPRTVATCRCGAAMPTDDLAAEPVVEAASDGGGSTSLIAVGLVALVLAGGAYWVLKGRAPASTASSATASLQQDAQNAAGLAAAASPEARAWDAAANAKSASTPDTAPAPAASPVAPLSAPGSIEEMVDRVMPAVVLIETTAGRGSGFFVSHDTLITNVHVVQNDVYVTLRRMDGSSMSARVDKKAPALDLAVLKVSSPSPNQAVIPMGSAQALKPGQEIIVIGSALGTLQNSVSRGIVSGLRTAGGATLVQTDAAVNPGNSGGPMLDRNGTVIGITTMGYKGAEGLNFGVAIDHARDLMEGRQANLGTTGGLTDIQSKARGSESDRQQQQGEEQFRGGLAQLADGARNLDTGWKRFREQCYKGPVSGTYDREWFAVLAPRGLPGDAGAGCTNFYSGMESDIKQFRGLMQRLLGDARRANVLPGTIREGLRTNHLEFEW
jgi:S1-C subfamily serine protease